MNDVQELLRLAEPVPSHLARRAVEMRFQAPPNPEYAGGMFQREAGRAIIYLDPSIHPVSELYEILLHETEHAFDFDKFRDTDESDAKRRRHTREEILAQFNLELSSGHLIQEWDTWARNRSGSDDPVEKLRALLDYPASETPRSED